MFQTVGIVCKPDDARVLDTARALAQLLDAAKVHMVVDTDSAEASGLTNAERMTPERMGTECDLIIVIGGDGTILNVARTFDIPRARLLGVNLGRLGFLADITPDDMEGLIGPILAGEFDEDLRFMLDTRVRRSGEQLVAMRALNEIVLHKHNIARLIEFETYIDGRLLNSQRSDGLIVATPTGSTAYALSGGGPILHPNLDALVLVPICPHTLSSRPIVVDSDARIEIIVRDQWGNGAELTGDGQPPVTLQADDRVIVRRRPEPLHMIHPRGHDHFEVLRAKLHWARGL